VLETFDVLQSYRIFLQNLHIPFILNCRLPLFAISCVDTIQIVGRIGPLKLASSLEYPKFPKNVKESDNMTSLQLFHPVSDICDLLKTRSARTTFLGSGMEFWFL
jgi:hypothetical protein